MRLKILKTLLLRLGEQTITRRALHNRRIEILPLISSAIDALEAHQSTSELVVATRDQAIATWLEFELAVIAACDAPHCPRPTQPATVQCIDCGVTLCAFGRPLWSC